MSGGLNYTMLAGNHVEFTKTRQGSGHIKPQETCPEWERLTCTCSSQGPNQVVWVKAVTKEGKAWYKKHTEVTYFSNVCIDRDSLAREFLQILSQIRELRREFIFAELEDCNLHMVREFSPTGRRRQDPIL
ncbi:hypothetical protein H5410_023063 [Solanum commersonii]|uniref:Uncharacterized protein n=1 Tax=Solanum commersonii TaxID=4109 RepID=A0A9J5ZJX4_SOLCO|nr:hypothetical protein H5410_023063 [Solanum commersonii]